MLDFCLTYLGILLGCDASPSQQVIVEPLQKTNQVDEGMIEVCLLVLALMKDSIKNQLGLQIILDRAMMKIIPIICDFKMNHSPSNGFSFEQLHAMYKQYRTPII